jgi:ParB family chromosome partitioning protein
MQKTIEMIKTSDLVASRWNRAANGNGELKELAESIKAHGILQPLIVREGNEIVAGHRRWRAAEMAGLEKVPCIFSALSDQDAKVAQITENLMRKNLNPMEEARAFQTLREGNAHTHQTIADIVGKDVKYVYRSLELLKLPKKAQVALEKGLISAAHGHQLARVGSAQIDTIVAFAITPGFRSEIPSVEDLKAEISRRVEKKLSAAPFVKDKEFAGKIACKGCPSNTANQDMLFDDAEEGFCTNNTCFAAKLKQFYKDLQGAGEKRWPHLRFIGTASSAYGEDQTIKGYRVVEAKDPNIKKLLDEVDSDGKTPNMGFGILKPSAWGKVKAAKLVVLRKMKEGEKASAENQRDPDDEYKWQFIRAYTDSHCQKERAAAERAQELANAAEEEVEEEALKIWEKNKAAIIAEYKKKEGKK